MNKPKILVLDIETSPIISYTWGLFDQNIGLNQIKSDWHILAWAAKWLGDKPSKIMYKDQRNAKNIEDDKEMLQGIWKLMDEADIIIGQNSNSFDIKKLNARFIINGLKPPSSYTKVDTVKIARKHFGMTSNKLEYLSNKLCTKYKKLTHAKFAGFELWKECLKGNKKAWDEMKKYNCHDVLATEELYKKLEPYDNSINYNLYTDGLTQICACGSTDFIRKGFKFTKVGKYQRYKCVNCGSEAKDRTNLFSDEKKKSLKV